MAVNTSAGIDGFRKSNDKDFPSFNGGNDTEAKARTSWAIDIFREMFLTVVPASTTVTTATATMESALVGMSAPGGIAVLAAAANDALTAIGAGMTGYAPVTPPVLTVDDFQDPSLNAPGVTAQAAASLIIGKIAAKVPNGTAFLLPVGPLVNWS